MLFSQVAQLRSGADRIIVIGSGAVGLYAGTELAKRGRDVVVIESGSRHLGSFEPQSFLSVGRPHIGIRDSRSRSLGGTTNLWGGQLVQFQPIDFAGRDWLPGSKWPVSYDEIEPYYRPTYQNLGVDADTLDDDAVWKIASSTRPNFDGDFEAFLTRWLKVPGFANLYSGQIERDCHLSVLTEHAATGFRADGLRITAVRVIDHSGATHWIEGRIVILAAGTIENARLLLHSATEARECPWRNNRNIGAYFQDHLGGTVAVIHPNDKKRFFQTFCTIARSGNKFQPKIRMRNETLARNRILNIQGIFAFESSASEHLVYLKQFLKAAVFSRKVSGVGDALRAAGSFRYLFPLMWRYIWDHRVFVPSTSKIMFGIQAEQAPCAASRIRIDPQHRDKHGLPRVILDWRLGDLELGSIREFAVRADKALQAGGYGRLDIDPGLLALNPAYLDTLHDTFHQAGGTIMGWSEQDGVVDRELRVFGTDNLYIGGASVFRTGGNANVTFTALAFATRLVEHLTREPPAR
jgi:choline dehydrogenase-like flavoprotein